MKKLVVFFIVIIFICVSGYSIAYEKSIDSLDEAYFYTVKKVEGKENIKIEDIKKLLKNYKFNKKDLSYQKEIKTCYQFTSNNEILSIFTTKSDGNTNENIKTIGYYISADEKIDKFPAFITLSYKNEDSDDKFSFVCNVKDITTFKEVSKIVDDKNNLYLNTYNKIMEDMYSKNKLTLKDMEKMMKMKPISDSHLERFDYENKGKKYKVSQNIYKNDYEDLYINYINAKNKIGRVIYTKSYTKTSQKYDIQLVKSAFVLDIIDKRLISKIEGNLESILLQEKLLNIIKKIV